MNPKNLEKIGLTKNESRIYTTLLKLGTTKTGAILKESNINSGKIYEILNSLKIKGLISDSKINGVKFFTAESPKHLLDYIDSKKQQLNYEEKKVKEFVPQLEELRNINYQDNLSMTYSGYKGNITAVEKAYNSLNEKDEIWAMGVTNIKDKIFNRFWVHFNKKRVKDKIHTKLLFSDLGELNDEYTKMKYTQVKLLSGISPSAITIFGDKIVHIASYKKPISCILIYDKNIATSFKTFFKQLWNISKKVN